MILHVSVCKFLILRFSSCVDASKKVYEIMTPLKDAFMLNVNDRFDYSTVEKRFHTLD